MMKFEYLNEIVITMIVVVVAVAIIIWLISDYYKRRIWRLQQKYDELSRLEMNEALELEKERKLNDELSSAVKCRKDLMYWVARELKEHKGSSRYDYILDKMIELTHYERLTEVPLKEQVPVNQLCRCLVEEFKNKAMPGIDVTFKSDITDFYAPRTNRECLEKVLRNLLENAVNNTTAGFIKLDVKENVGRLDITVTDTGRGIAPHSRRSAFSLLHPIGRFKHKQRIGAGLNMCRTLVEYMGGSIFVDPHYKNGTRVVFDIAV